MNKILNILLITIFTQFLTCLKTDAAVLTQAYLVQEIKKQAQVIIKKEIKSNLNIETDNYYISTVSVPGNNYKVQVTCGSQKFNPITIFKVNILLEGKILKTFGVPISISIFETVAIAAKNISKDELFSQNNIKYELREISLINNNIILLSDSLDNSLADRSFKMDEIIDKRFIKSPPDILMYNPVSLIFENDDITISLDGEALESGKIGEYIRVKNKTYKKQYRGQIIEKNKVMVKL
jgi:flagella basal body P-ring formation protein FlgA